MITCTAVLKKHANRSRPDYICFTTNPDDPIEKTWRALPCVPKGVPLLDMLGLQVYEYRELPEGKIEVTPIIEKTKQFAYVLAPENVDNFEFFKTTNALR